MENVYTEKYKGCVVEICPDGEISESPNEWGDDNLFLVHYHRDFEVKRDEIITQNEVGALITGDLERFDDGNGYFKNEMKEIKKKYYWFPVDAYIHSGICLSLAGGFHGRLPQGHERFDVSSVGLILASKKEFKTKAKAEKGARGLLDTWNDYLSGNIYGFMTRDEKNDYTIDSCCGFYGDYENSGILEEARGSIDHYVEKDQKRVVKKNREKLYNDTINVIKKNRFQSRVLKELN